MCLHRRYILQAAERVNRPMSKLLIFSGVHRRYKYVVNKLLDRYPGSALIVQDIVKGDYVGKYDVSGDFERSAVDLLNGHLMKRDEVEGRYYPDDEFHLGECPSVLRVNTETLNSEETVRWVKREAPSVVFSFGIGMIKRPLLNTIADCRSVNLHLGLSPWFKSSDTLLWPLYMQRPCYTGTSLHEIDSKADNGPIYHQQRTVFDVEDTIHDVFCRTLIQSAGPVVRLMDLLLAGESLEPKVQNTSGKTFYRGEFTPNHLRIIYQLIEEGLLQRCARGQCGCGGGELFSCLGGSGA